MRKFRNALLSMLFGAMTLVGLVVVFAFASILQEFHVYAHDAGGGFPLFLIELVLALLAALVAALFCFDRLTRGCWLPDDEAHNGHHIEGKQASILHS